MYMYGCLMIHVFDIDLHVGKCLRVLRTCMYILYVDVHVTCSVLPRAARQDRTFSPFLIHQNNKFLNNNKD